MLGQVQVSIFGADNVPDTLVGSCGSNPGLACRLVWNVTHDGQAASLTKNFFAGPVHLLLQVLFVVLLAFLIQAIAHRVINRLTERATSSLLPNLRGSMANSRFAPSRPETDGTLPPRRVTPPAQRLRRLDGRRRRGGAGRGGGRRPAPRSSPTHRHSPGPT